VQFSGEGNNQKYHFIMFSQGFLALVLLLPTALTFQLQPSRRNAKTERVYTKQLHAHSRREILIGSVAAIQFASEQARADDSSSILAQIVSSQAESLELENGLLESRVLSNVLNPPPYGMEGPDIFYPS
jgi:hypothetical protein